MPMPAARSIPAPAWNAFEPEKADTRVTPRRPKSMALAGFTLNCFLTMQAVEVAAMAWVIMVASLFGVVLQMSNCRTGIVQGKKAIVLNF